MKFKHVITFLFLLPLSVLAQVIQLGGDSLVIDYASPKDYILAKPAVIGDVQTDPNVIRLISGLTEGDRVSVPGDKFSKAVENLWKQGLFDDVKIIAKKIEGEILFVEIIVVERPRLITYRILGVNKSQSDDLRDKLKIGGKILTDHLILTSIETIKGFFIDKGYYDVKVDTVKSLHTQGSVSNGVKIDFVVKKGERIKIADVVFNGNEYLSDDKLRRTMKETRRADWYDFWISKKYIESKYDADKPKIIQKYAARGFRDAQIVKDTVYRVGNKVKIEITLNEGHKYYFRNIIWIGNAKYSSTVLSQVLGIKKGDVYNQSELDSKLNMSQTGMDISSLYMDDGYLFFHVEPVESLVENDSIDLEMRIYEGKQAIINKITVVGNTKTNDRVIMREIRTKPGQLFRRSDIIRTQRELSQLGYFNAEKMGVNPVPHPETGTVDIEYTVEEKPSDQLEMSAGFGAGRVVGTLGFSFTNFSTYNVFKKDAWRPLPSGDGQRLSIRAQSSGLNYQGANFSFTEPWLGGKKPLSFSISGYVSHQSNRYYKTDPKIWDLKIQGASIGLGKRLKWPDDYFNIYHELNFQHYVLQDYPYGIFPTGEINNINYKVTVSRNSIDRPIFETRGSNIVFSAQLSPPYSAFNDKNYSTLEDQDKYQFLEFQKYKFTAAFYTSLIDKTAKDGTKSSKLVLYTKAGFGFLGSYNSQIGAPPFERFYLGGSGLSGQNPIQANEIIALRGYTDRIVYSGSDQAQSKASLGNPFTRYENGSMAICKFTAELRVPISLNPSATVYALAFADAGNSWGNFKEFNPFQLKRSVGVGVRLFLPMFGLLGFDYGWGMDPIPGSPNVGRNPVSGKFQGQFHFIIGGVLGEL